MHILMVAGEASGDLHAARLAEEIRNLRPGTLITGFGGPAMEAAGVNLRCDITPFAVVGLWEVLRSLPLFRRIMQQTRDILLHGGIDAVLLIDFPGFNLRVAETAHSLGIPVIYYIAPQVWAWHASRIKRMKQYIDLLLVVFEFEVDFFKSHGMDRVVFVGHPLMDTISTDRNNRPASDGKTIGILPGSREREVRSLLPVMLKACGIISKKHPGTRFLLGRARGISRDMIDEMTAGSDFTVDMSEGSQEVFRSSEAAMVASGTATLEGCIVGTPMVVTYRVSPISHMFIRKMIRTPYVSLVNILAGKEVVPELLQDDLTPANLAETTLRILAPSTAKVIRDEMKRVRTKLGKRGASRRAAMEVVSFLEGRK